MSYRKLLSSEIELLKINGCKAADWEEINVAHNFIPELIEDVNFSGQVFIGTNVKMQRIFHLSNYTIEDGALLQNINTLSVEAETSFGNGISISVFNEGGGRELTMYDVMSSQIAYMLVTARHDKRFIQNLENLIQEYCNSRKSSIGLIGKDSIIKHSGIIKNVWIENKALIEGITYLSDGTVLSSDLDPIEIKSGVSAKKFIIQSGSTISDGVLLDNCFVGQGVRIGKQYSAENSVFFANCEAFHGEAVSIFAGPYTVTHHKSSLLIAAMFSFYNAGSGTNQSNHMYKLGPLHQGILERGSKTGSFSYMLWPSHVGAFSVVIGKHYTNFDSSEFPFSYINEETGKSLLTPAMNMFTVGTRRDSLKWAARDRRKDPIKFDKIRFELFNPYIIKKIIRGMTRMKELLENARKDQEYVIYKGLHIKRLLLKTCIKYYEMAVKIYIGHELIKRISENSESGNPENLPVLLKYDAALLSEDWIDAAGMIIPKNNYDDLIASINRAEIKNLKLVDEKIEIINSNFEKYSWAWCAKLIEERYNTKIEKLTAEQLSQLIKDWRENSIKLNNMIMKDAEKEFDQTSKIGFGIDSGDEIRSSDFENVRGKYEENKFVLELIKESEQINALAEKTLFFLQRKI